jgi:hypothetical protein
LGCALSLYPRAGGVPRHALDCVVEVACVEREEVVLPEGGVQARVEPALQNPVFHSVLQHLEREESLLLAVIGRVQKPAGDIRAVLKGLIIGDVELIDQREQLLIEQDEVKVGRVVDKLDRLPTGIVVVLDAFVVVEDLVMQRVVEGRLVQSLDGAYDLVFQGVAVR